jgi:very-short-patch-repair endonuclease
MLTAEKNKAIRLIEYLLRLASLRTKLVRDITDYERVLWLSEIPQQEGCFTQAWGRDEDFDSDIWIEVQAQREPELPAIPHKCEGWIDKSSLRNKNDLPELLPERIKESKNPEWREGTDQSEYISATEYLKDFPEIQKAWDRYLEERWLPWVEDHNAWESVHEVYSKLFAIHQEQLRLGEEYELILGLGLLTWQTPSGQRVRRHLIVADAVLEFEARLGKFTVRPHPEGAKLRPELDMLDVEEQPIRAEETAKASLADSGDDPWDKGCTEGVLQALVHSINPQGEYVETLKKGDIRASEKPVVEYAPALILRKRSAKDLTETLKRIKERIEKGDDIPGEFADLAEIEAKIDGESGDGPEEQNRAFDGEVFFPKPSNEEQRRIVDKIRSASGVLVQGPPGTGKSHTIANLICHLLATGQRILITAKTPRALQVLEGLIPPELRPLCINLLGSGPEERRSLESSVGGILRRNEEWNEDRAKRERKELEERLQYLREEQTKINRRLRDIRESETHTQSIADGAYRGTAARIAKAVNRDRAKYEWFTDKVPLNQTCPLHVAELNSFLKDFRYFTYEKRRELQLLWPEELPSTENFAKLVQDEEKAAEEEHRAKKGADERIADLLSKNNPSAIEEIRGALSRFFDARRRLTSSPYSWMVDALRDVLCGNSALWKELARVTKDVITSVEPLVEIADNNSIEIPDTTNIRTLYEDALKLKEHMENGGKLGWGPFRPKTVKERIHVIKTVRIGGHPCSTIEHLSVLCGALRVRIECEKAWGFWVGRADKAPGPYALQLTALKSMCNVLEDALRLENIIEKCREAIRHCAAISEPDWTDEFQVKELIASCQLAQDRHCKQLAAEKIQSIEAPVSSIAANSKAHPVTIELLNAIRDRDLNGFANASSKIQELKTKRQRLQEVDAYLSKMSRLLPNLTDELKRTCDEAYWDERLQHIGEAWRWAQARYWVEEYIRKEDLPALAKRAKQIEDEINVTIAKLASLHAWSFCFSRLKEDHRRHMEAWRQSMRRLGKGTGKHAPRHRREAQQHLNQCRDAVPAWVMPLHRVWDTVDPAPRMFDVIIVDEASQCGLEALPLFYLGKKILIVGDDKQISPEAGFVDKNAVFQLMEQFLYDFHHKDSFHRDASLFDHGKLRYGTQRIALCEHFRCMPEIIRFSNDLCYTDTPLIPLRQYGPDRLSPLQHVFVESGYREGSNNRAINRPEAQAIVEKIVELCFDDRYEEKTMGVIVLQGDAQAGLIESLLLDRLGAEEMERRRLICGNPYSFQGDERDVMFLSMVAAPNERIGPLTKAADERRFNVAVSRARDQVWLFHSVRLEDLSEKDLRRRLLEFFEKARPQLPPPIDRDELERRAHQDNRSIVKPPIPFESWFEVDVALELLRRGFVVTPQFEVAGKRIDLVVEGGHVRLAVECDGDHWHGADRYEEDMQRQRQLERCGWEFFRVRESAFYANKDRALNDLWLILEERGICPVTNIRFNHKGNTGNTGNVKDFKYEVENNEEGYLFSDLYDSNDGNTAKTTACHIEDVSSKEIRNAIIGALSKCPKWSCTLQSLTARVLKELGILTRGNPRKTFDRRVMRVLNDLENQGIVQKYKAKNKRVRLKE